MSLVFTRISARVDPCCLSDSMNKGGCAVDTAGAPTPYLVIDLDHHAAPITATARKCDFLFLAPTDGDRLWVVPLELKSTAINPVTVTSQLQAGARVAERTVRDASAVRFVPVAAHGRNLHRRTYTELAKKRITFRRKHFSIMTMLCGSSLADALAHATVA